MISPAARELHPSALGRHACSAARSVVPRSVLASCAHPRLVLQKRGITSSMLAGIPPPASPADAYERFAFTHRHVRALRHAENRFSASHRVLLVLLCKSNFFGNARDQRRCSALPSRCWMLRRALCQFVRSPLARVARAAAAQRRRRPEVRPDCEGPALPSGFFARVGSVNAAPDCQMIVASASNASVDSADTSSQQRSVTRIFMGIVWASTTRCLRILYAPYLSSQFLSRRSRSISGHTRLPRVSLPPKCKPSSAGC
jgi:hypothetical protein